MSQFYDDVQTFQERWRTQARKRPCCWSCSARLPLVHFNIKKDFTTLDIPTQGCKDQIRLCPTCAVEYMNSFNRYLDEKQGRKGPSHEWTVEQLIRFLQGQQVA